MKKMLILLMTALGLMLSAFSLAGCGNSAGKDGEELVVFAAASMSETLTKAGEIFCENHEGVNIVYNFDSSGTLKTQIEEGAKADIFISAGQEQMDSLENEYILDGSRFDFLENTVVLVLSDASNGEIHSFEDLAKGIEGGSLMFGMGNSDVPVGQYTMQILKYLDIDADKYASSITYASNAKELVTQVSEAVVDCAVVYQTDAYSAGLTVMDTATDEMCDRAIYPAAIIKGTDKEELAREFLLFLCADDTDAIFEEVGFTTID